MLATQFEAYRTVQKTTMSGREVEAAALTRAAMMLTNCRKNWDIPGRDMMLSEAVRFNQMVWSVFQSELVKPDNPLPKKIREDILSLSIFIDKRSLEILASPSPEKLDIIVNINLNIAAGLKGSPNS